MPHQLFWPLDGIVDCIRPKSPTGPVYFDSLMNDALQQSVEYYLASSWFRLVFKSNLEGLFYISLKQPRALDSKSKDLGLNSHCWLCVEVLGKPLVPYYLCPPAVVGTR